MSYEENPVSKAVSDPNASKKPGSGNTTQQKATQDGQKKTKN
jgi:hypothetical protein